MTLNLFQIEQEYMSLAQQIIECDGAVTPEIESQLAITEAQLEHKGRGYGFVIKQAESEIEIIESEIKRLEALKSARAKMANRMKDSLKNAMELFGIDKLESPTLKVSFRKSESVDVDEPFLPDEYFNVREVRTPNKAKIKADLEAGKQIQGACILTKNNLQIK